MGEGRKGSSYISKVKQYWIFFNQRILVETYFDDVAYLFGFHNLSAVENLIDLN